MMGIYKVSIKEIVEELEEALDNIEGDFSDDDLHKALTILHQYPHTSNSKVRKEQWEDAKNKYGK